MCDQNSIDENVRAEYAALISFHNSIVTHRFTLLGFFLASVGLLHQNGLNIMEAIFILLLTPILYLIECRNRVLYTHMSRRAMEIEIDHWELNWRRDKTLPLFSRFQYHDLKKKPQKTS